MRIQNEGAGKSSWWVINPDAKPGRNPRRTRERSNTIETTTKVRDSENNFYSAKIELKWIFSAFSTQIKSFPRIFSKIFTMIFGNFTSL